MPSSLHLGALDTRGRLSVLAARSAVNIRRSRALLAAADIAVRTARRIRQPKLAGGSDRPDWPPRDLRDPRVLRTWTKMKNGALPTNGVRRRWVGPGRGGPCSGCGDIIAVRETEFEIDFSDALLLRFHRDCFRMWQSFDGARR